MSLSIHLLGRPTLDRAGADAYRFRSRKSWGLLSHLILSEHPPTRSRLAALLFESADDPLRALRWNLSEIRRALGDDGSLEGDPVVLTLAPRTVVDVDVIMRGSWTAAVRLPGLGAELLDGMAFRDAAAFESWLLSARRLLAAGSEAILHEAALASLSRSAVDDAIDYAVRAVAMNPFDENNQALLIRAYRVAGADDAAERQLAACTELFAAELGVPPGPAVRAAITTPADARLGIDGVSAEAVVEAGAAAVGAGAVTAGVETLRAGVALADRATSRRLRVSTRLELAEALIHSLRGDDEEGSTILHEAMEIARTGGGDDLIAHAQAELGYVDFLRARYRRAELWLTSALEAADVNERVHAKATTYLGSVASDLAEYGRAATLLEEAAAMADTVADERLATYAHAMLGRLHVLRDDLDRAAEHLDTAITLAERAGWLAFLPWPQAFRGELDVRRGELGVAAETLQHAFARACQLRDPCWEGAAARGLALAAEAGGDADGAFRVLADARVRCNRLSDTYLWLDAYILDAQCDLGLRHGHAATTEWIEALHQLATRTGMAEMIVRALHYRDRIGGRGDGAAARLLAADIDNPALDRLLGRVAEHGAEDRRPTRRA